MPELRSYQSDDVAAVIAAHAEHRCVLGRAPTGSGKAVALAAIAQHYAQFGKVMVLVDVGKLVHQLAETVEWFTGQLPGVEMADRTVLADWFDPPRIIVGTVQTQYSGPPGRERYRRFDPSEYSALLLDECELFLAPKAREVVDWYVASNPSIRVFGCSATPFRTDGIAMAELFDHVAFDRDIRWGVDDGWLVRPLQGFVRVSLDFSTLKIRTNDYGERDYSDAEIAERINNERTLIELAQGIIHAAGDRRSIIACPDVESAKAVAHYLDAERPGCCRYVYGEMSDDDKDAVMNGHRRGEFQFLSSVLMLTKGYDDPGVSAVFNCRKTRSKRLYQQLMGRCTRPARSLASRLGEIPDAAARIDAIFESEKPDAVMFNMVGVDDSVRDVTVIDILGERMPEAVIERAKRNMLAEDAGELDTDAEAARAEQEQQDDERREREEQERRQRRLVQVKSHVEVEYADDGGGGCTPNENVSLRQLSILRKAKVEEQIIAALSESQAKEITRKIVARWKSGMSSWGQCRVLNRCGWDKAESAAMTREQASAAIEAAKANGWRRPQDQRWEGNAA